MESWPLLEGMDIARLKGYTAKIYRYKSSTSYLALGRKNDQFIRSQIDPYPLLMG
jgi:hypothetical protein